MKDWPLAIVLVALLADMAFASVACLAWLFIEMSHECEKPPDTITVYRADRRPVVFKLGDPLDREWLERVVAGTADPDYPSLTGTP